MPTIEQHHEPPLEKMPGHWLLAKMGKRVLRPGGLKLTRQLLSDLAIAPSDDVVEFAPGLGITARMTLSRLPHSYIAVEREPAAAAKVQSFLGGPNQRCIVGTAQDTGLPDASASAIYGEAMLTMQPPSAKQAIIAEAVRLLRPGGRYGIHELCLIPDDLDPDIREAIQHEMSDDIHVGVRPLTVGQWCLLLEGSGLKITASHFAPMHLLEPVRLIFDEGLLRTMRFLWNVARSSDARRRIIHMRQTFRKYRDNLAAIAIVCTKP